MTEPDPVTLYVEEAARRHRVTMDEIMDRCRRKRVCHARFEVYRRLRNDGWTLKRIAHAMGRDHSTVKVGVNTVAPGLWFAGPNRSGRFGPHPGCVSGEF
jgi:chromosomal replication initiation ATPase DnaA